MKDVMGALKRVASLEDKRNDNARHWDTRAYSFLKRFQYTLCGRAIGELISNADAQAEGNWKGV